MIYKKLNKIQFIFAIITSIFLFSFYFLFNLNYLSKWIDEKYDCTTYDYYVRLGLPQYLFNPHHIGFDYVGQIMYKFALKHGYTGPSMIILQLRNLIISSIGLAFIFFFFYKITKKYLLSLFLSLSIFFTAGVWIYSQINDTPIIHSIILVLLFFMTLYFPQVKHKKIFSFLLGIIHSINIFFHQSDFIFIFVIFFVIIFSERLINIFPENNEDNYKFNFLTKNKISFNFFSSLNNIKYFLIYLITFIMIVSFAYYYVGIVKIGLTLDINKAQDFNKIKGASYFFNWLILYTKIDYWGKGYEQEKSFLIQKIYTGISTYFYQPTNYHLNKNYNKNILNIEKFYSKEYFLQNLIIIFILFIISSTLLLFVFLLKKYNYSFISIIIFLILYIIFSCWWEPDYREFWVATMFGFWILSLFVLNFYIDKLNIVKSLIYFVIISFLILFCFLLFYYNFNYFIYPNAGNYFRAFNIM